MDTLYLDHQTFSAIGRTLGQHFGRDTYTLTDELEGGRRMLDLENLRRVKKLAIHYPWYWTNSREENMAIVLQTFGNIEELSYVLNDYHVARDTDRLLMRGLSFRSWKPSVTDEVLLVEPIRYGSTQLLYQNFSPSRGGFDRLAEVPSPIMLETKDYTPLNLTRHKALQEQGIKKKNTYPWNIPTASFKVLLSKHYVELLKTARANCEKKLADTLERRRELEALSVPERLDYLRLIEAEDNEEEAEYCDPEAMLYDKDEEYCYTRVPTLEDYL
jgi:hypothetical protein